MNAERDQDTGLIRRRPPRPLRAAPRRRRAASLDVPASRIDVDVITSPLTDAPHVRVTRHFWSDARQEFGAISVDVSETCALSMFINSVKRTMTRFGGNPLGALVICALTCRVTYL